MVGVNALLQWNWGVSVIIQVVNMEPKFEMIKEWLGVFQAHVSMNSGLMRYPLLCCSLIERTKRSIGTHELHEIILFVWKLLKFFHPLYLWGYRCGRLPWNRSEINFCYYQRSSASTTIALWWLVDDNNRCQLHQISMHTETTAHVHHFSRMLKRLCEPQEKICCLYIFWKLFGST